MLPATYLLLGVNMKKYDFRLRFNLSESYRIESDAEELELLALQPGERIRLCSSEDGEPIKNNVSAIVKGGLYGSENQARDAAERSKLALLYWAVEKRVGIDFGDGKPRSSLTKYGLAKTQANLGRPVRNDIHGIDVYEHDEKLMFVKTSANAVVGKGSNPLIETFHRQYVTAWRPTEKQVVASEIYASSFFDVSARSRFITLVTAVEALLEPLKRPDEVQSLVAELEAKTRLSTIDKPTKESIIGSLQRLGEQSIGQAGRELACRLLPNEIFDGQSSAEFFNSCYNFRSQILHNGKISDKLVDIRQLANATEMFVARLLLESLNNGANQGIVDTEAEC